MNKFVIRTIMNFHGCAWRVGNMYGHMYMHRKLDWIRDISGLKRQFTTTTSVQAFINLKLLTTQ